LSYNLGFNYFGTNGLWWDSDSYINNDDESFGFQYEMYLLMGGSSFGDERFVESYYGRSIRCVKD